MSGEQDAIYLSYISQVMEAFVIANQPTVTFTQMKAHFVQLFNDNELDPMKCQIRTKDDVELAVVNAINQLTMQGTIDRIKAGVYQYHGFVPVFEKICTAHGCGNVTGTKCGKCDKALCSKKCLHRHVSCNQCHSSKK